MARPRLVVEMTLGTLATADTTGIFTLGTSVLGGPDVLGTALWQDVTGDLVSVSISPDATGPLDSPSPTTCEVVLENYRGDYDPLNPASPYVSSSPPPGTKFGAYLDGPALDSSSWASSVTEWEALTGITLSATRRYAGTDYVVGPTLTAMIAAGVRICLSYSPPYNPVSSTDRDSIDAALATLKAAGADVQVALHHEPFFGGLTASQYVAMIDYYGPTVRQYYPLWAVFSGNDTNEANGYYPGDGKLDGIAVDQYSTTTTWLTQAAAMADAHNLPLGLWEFNAANDFGINPSPVTAATNADGLTFLTTVKNFFLNRIATGRANGDILIFSATGATTGTQNFLGHAFSQNGGFEGGVGNWVAGTNNTVAASTAQAHSGSGSLLLTCTTAGTVAAAHCATANITTQGVPVSPGDVVGFSFWARPDTTARFAQGGVLFYNSAGTFLSTSFAASVIETAGAWKFFSGTATAPATAAFAKFNPQVTSVALGEKHYIDDPQIGVLPATVDHTAPVQYPWDYRIAKFAEMQAALDGTSIPAGGTSTLDIGQQVRITAVDDATATVWPIWWGDIGDISPDYGYEPTVAFSCSDGLARLASAQISEAPPSFDGDSTGTRIGRILDAALWPTGRRALDTGLVNVQADTFGDSALSLAGRIVSTELGALFVDPSSVMTFYDRLHVYTSSRSTTVQAVFSDSGTDIDIPALAGAAKRGETFNDVRVTRDGGTEQIASDAASQALRGILTFTGSVGTMAQTDSDAASTASFVLARYVNPTVRFPQLDVDATTQDMWATLLALQRFDRVRIDRTYGTAAVALSRQVLISGIGHDITADRWQMSFALRDAETFSPFILGTSSLGGTDLLV